MSHLQITPATYPSSRPLASGCVLGFSSNIVSPVLGFGVVMEQLEELPSCGGDGVLRGRGEAGGCDASAGRTSLG